jgi:hypothetical protein
MDSVQTCETTVNSHQSIRRYNPEDGHLPRILCLFRFPYFSLSLLISNSQRSLFVHVRFPKSILQFSQILFWNLLHVRHIFRRSLKLCTMIPLQKYGAIRTSKNRPLLSITQCVLTSSGCHAKCILKLLEKKRLFYENRSLMAKFASPSYLATLHITGRLILGIDWSCSVQSVPQTVSLSLKPVLDFRYRSCSCFV